MIRKRKSFARPAPDFGAPFKCGDSSRLLRWCEKPDSYMRRVGFADDVYRTETGRRGLSEGYYCDSHMDTVARGVVFRLSGGRGFVAGIADPNNDGPAMLAVCEAPEATAIEAAKYADNLAEWHAEAERDYQESWQAGQAAGETWRETMGEALDSVSAARTMLRAARAAMARALAQRDGVLAGFVPPDVCAEAVRLYRQALESSRAKRDAACEARREAWKAFRDAEPATWNGTAREAFREGAGI